MVGRSRGRTGRGWDAAPAGRRRSNADEWTRDPDDPAERPSGPTRKTAGGRTGSASRESENLDPGEKAREICLRLLAVRPRTRAELASALRQRGIANDVAAEVLARYAEVGIVDDGAFARAWVSSRHHGRGLARRALATELRQKGVDTETLGSALDELDPDQEAATARALVDRKLRTERGGPSEALLRRLVGMLARKGYPPGLAIRVVREAIAEWPGSDQPGNDRRGADLAETDFDLVAEALEAQARSVADGE